MKIKPILKKPKLLTSGSEPQVDYRVLADVASPSTSQLDLQVQVPPSVSCEKTSEEGHASSPSSPHDKKPKETSEAVAGEDFCSHQDSVQISISSLPEEPEETAPKASSPNLTFLDSSTTHIEASPCSDFLSRSDEMLDSVSISSSDGKHSCITACIGSHFLLYFLKLPFTF